MKKNVFLALLMLVVAFSTVSCKKEVKENDLKDNELNCFVSAGNTGAMLVGAMFSVKTISGVIRPCITGIIPKENGGFGIVLDVGTNADCKPDVLYQFAILGNIYAKEVYKIQNPKIGLLNIGEEEEKGNNCYVGDKNRKHTM